MAGGRLWRLAASPAHQIVPPPCRPAIHHLRTHGGERRSTSPSSRATEDVRSRSQARQHRRRPRRAPPPLACRGHRPRTARRRRHHYRPPRLRPPRRHRRQPAALLATSEAVSADVPPDMSSSGRIRRGRSQRACSVSGRRQPSRRCTKLPAVRCDHGIRQAVRPDVLAGDSGRGVRGSLEFARPPLGRRRDEQGLLREAAANRFDRGREVAVCRNHHGDIEVVVVGVVEEANRDVHVGLLLFCLLVGGATGLAGQRLVEEVAVVDLYASRGVQRVDVYPLALRGAGGCCGLGW